MRLPTPPHCPGASRASAGGEGLGVRIPGSDVESLLLFSHLVVSDLSDSATPGTAARQASLPLPISQRLHRLKSIESMMPTNHLILCHPFSSCLQSFPGS